MEVTIQGEVHGSEKDRKAVLDHDLGSFDALLIEGRKPEITVENLSIGYATFIIGYTMGSWIQSAIETESGINLEKEAKKADIGYNDTIDAEIPTMYDMVPRWYKQGIGAFLFLLLPVAILAVNRLILVLYISTVPLLYTGLVDNLGIRFRNGERNRYMANEISEIAKNEGYSEVIVLCGQSHLYGLAHELENKRFTVNPHDSTHWLRYPHLAARRLKRTQEHQ